MKKRKWSSGRHEASNIVKKLNNSLSDPKLTIKAKDSVIRRRKIFLSTMEREEMRFSTSKEQ